jgi:excisionase family DNA binding protein
MDSNIILKELAEIKQLTLLGAKKALTMTEAATLTGLSKSHLYKLCCAREIPYYKNQGGKLTYFDKNELEAWLLSRKVSTMQEIDQQATSYITTGKKGGNR